MALVWSPDEIVPETDMTRWRITSPRQTCALYGNAEDHTRRHCSFPLRWRRIHIYIIFSLLEDELIKRGFHGSSFYCAIYTKVQLSPGCEATFCFKLFEGPFILIFVYSLLYFKQMVPNFWTIVCGLCIERTADRECILGLLLKL